MPLEKPLPPEQGWTDVTAPELITWDKPGETIAGELISVAPIAVKGKNVLQYVLSLGDKRFKFLGTFDICQKLTRSHIGCRVRIKYLGEDDSITGGPNKSPMKVFSIQTAGVPTPNMHGVTVTDEDIPF